MRQRILRAVTYLVIFFFTWTMGGIGSIAYAAYNEIQKPKANRNQSSRPEAKFQKAMDDLKDIVSRKYSLETKRSKIREKRDAIESLDKDIKSQFADTENKLKNGGLPQEILQRHYNFVKHYEDNLKELRTNLDAADNSKTDKEFETHAQKIRQHLEKTSFKKSHKPLDPNKLPHRISDIKRKEPRITPEEFQKDLKQTASASLRAVSQTAWQSDDVRLLRSARNDSNSVILFDKTFDAMSFRPQGEIYNGSKAKAVKDSSPRISGIRNDIFGGIQPSFVIPAQAGIQNSQTQRQPLLLASNGPLSGLVETLPKFEKNNTASNPPFPRTLQGIKGDKGGFSISGNEPIVLALAHDAPTDADLAATIDVQLTPAIKAKAAELNYSPVKINNWVRNNVEYVPTYGSIQGADMCLQTLQGNDFDIASLLIALLRVSGIHARYVYGTIELPIDKVMNWVGGFTDANAAVNFIASGGTPVSGLISGGKISAVRMEHVWVEAFVKYYPLRGASHKTGQGDSWIPLDASYKQYTYTQGIDIKSAVPFDAQGFVDQIESTATIDQTNTSVTNINSTYIQQQMQNYQAQVKSYIDQNYPNATVGDVLGKKEIIKQNFSFLAGTLPYQKSIIGVRYSEIPDSLRHKITFKVTKDIYDEDSGTAINITKRLPEIAGKKITLSYSPATADDEAVLNSYLPKPHADGTPIQPSELPTSLPAYLINLKPELRIDGVVVAIGTAIGMGYQETFDMVFAEPGPTGGTDIVSNQIDAGTYQAIGSNLGKISQGQLTMLKAKLETTKAKLQNQDFTGLTKDDLIGDLLYTTALSYHAEVDSMKYIIASKLGINYITMPSETIFATKLNVLSLWGVPRTVNVYSLMMDADHMIDVIKARDGNTKTAKQFMLSSGISGSALEHSVPEQLFSTSENPSEGISAVKALKIANDQGIPIYTINKENVDLILPQLQLSQQVKADIQNAVNAGKEVTAPKTELTYNEWTGCGYIIINPDTGAGGYMVSGGQNGAAMFLWWIGYYILLTLEYAGIVAGVGLAAIVLGPFIFALEGVIVSGVVASYAFLVNCFKKALRNGTIGDAIKQIFEIPKRIGNAGGNPIALITSLSWQLGKIYALTCGQPG